MRRAQAPRLHAAWPRQGEEACKDSMILSRWLVLMSATRDFVGLNEIIPLKRSQSGRL